MFKPVAVFSVLVMLGLVIKTEAGFGFSTCDVISEHRRVLSGYGNEECVIFGNCWDETASECYKKIQCKLPGAEEVKCGSSGITASECEEGGCVWHDSYCHGHKCYEGQGHTHE
ncbi:Hypothetical predicted protein [Paramuricea clavata]|uniref:Uncharacterized protein n=1 Tax=Paramuricea clavata TaxID=317549 RepID=A0A6S7IU93_PARCT|nr:Hypothetical predicted protein [Paramuricea clavata]